MHRVELKGFCLPRERLYFPVPNAPCGVESKTLWFSFGKDLSFLMHRVELKVGFGAEESGILLTFLMHRVELKATR